MTNHFSSAIRPALVMTALFALLLGIAYPLAMTGIGQALFPAQANGSLIAEKGRVIGSSLIGQNFTGAGYFHPRPSAAGKGYDGQASSGSNLGPASAALVDRVKADRAALPATATPIPADVLTASASGLDPDISPANAYAQVARIAKARTLSEAQLRALVAESIETPFPAFLGDPHVNVLEINRRLDRIGAKPRS